MVYIRMHPRTATVVCWVTFTGEAHYQQLTPTIHNQLTMQNMQVIDVHA